jgi:hypothetical protein
MREKGKEEEAWLYPREENPSPRGTREGPTIMFVCPA